MKTALLFPGQGSQFVGMGKDLVEKYPDCKTLVGQANEVLDYDVGRLCFEGPGDALTSSDNAQPAIFLTSAVCLQALKVEQPATMQAAAAAGLSSGEWAALYSAGVISFSDAILSLRERGRLMQEACQERAGGMLSIIGLGSPELEKICEATGMEIANLNSPAQTVLSGPGEALDPAEKLAVEAGAKRVVKLNVAGAFHSTLMQKAADRFADFIQNIPFQFPDFPVVSNVTGLPHGAPDEIKSLMVKQITSPVKWIDCVQFLVEDGIGVGMECGPGKVLSGLVKRIDKRLSVHNIQDVSSLDSVLASLAE